MRLETNTGAPERIDTPLMVVLVASDGPWGERGVPGDGQAPAETGLPIEAGVPTGMGALDGLAGGVLGRAVAAGDFRGRARDRILGYRRGEQGPERVLFLGVGRLKALTPEKLRIAAGRAVRAAEARRVRALALCLRFLDEEAVGARGTRAAVEGLVLASWRFDELRSGGGGGGVGGGGGPGGEAGAEGAARANGEAGADAEAGAGSEAGAGTEARAGDGGRPPLVESAVVVAAPSAGLEEAVRIGHAFAAGENRARTLQARPGNIATPTHLADEARRIAGEAGLEVEVLGPAEMVAEGMEALVAVSRGSDEEPRLIVLRHRGGVPGEAPLVLVGKGLTFDAGGISIKPAKGMEKMKYDMSGGAAVMGAMWAVGRLGLPVNVIGVVPSSENLLSGSATKPGDVIGSRAGKSIEVINTDAEGRLILADALDYAAGWNPAAIVDCATLTGAAVIALGHHRSAVLGSDEDLIAELRVAGDEAAQPCWPLPMGPAYRKQLKSEVADLRNVGGRPAGTITAACFLSEFVGEIPWAHLDIAGTAYGRTKKPYLRGGPFGLPCRLLLEWVLARALS